MRRRRVRCDTVADQAPQQPRPPGPSYPHILEKPSALADLQQVHQAVEHEQHAEENLGHRPTTITAVTATTVRSDYRPVQTGAVQAVMPGPPVTVVAVDTRT